MIEASSSTAAATPTKFSWMKIIFEVANTPTASANSSAAAVTIRPVRSSPIEIASESLAPSVAGLLHPREQEDPVVGGEAERGREQDQRHRLVQGAGAGEGRAPPRAARPGR